VDRRLFGGQTLVQKDVPLLCGLSSLNTSLGLPFHMANFDHTYLMVMRDTISTTRAQTDLNEGRQAARVVHRILVSTNSRIWRVSTYDTGQGILGSSTFVLYGSIGRNIMLVLNA
jgi:hypothetical protein